MRKVLWIGATVVLLLAVGGLAFLLVDFDSPELGRQVLAAVGDKAGAQITAEKFHLNLWRGIRLDNVHLETRSPSGRLTVTAAGLLAEHRLLPLLRGRVEIDRVVLYQPAIELITPRAGQAPARPVPSPATAAAISADPAAPAASPGGGIALLVSRISVQDGTLATRTEGAAAPDIAIRGLAVELRDVAMDPSAATTVQAFSATGDLKTREIDLGTLKAAEGAGTIKLAAGHFRLEQFGLKLPQGRFLLGEFDADLNRDPFAYRFACNVDPLDTNAVLAAGDTANGFGPGKLTFTAEGKGTEVRDLVGDGHLEIAAGKVPGSPVFTGLEAVLGRAQLTGSAYQPFSIPFHIRGGRMTFEPFELRTSTLALALKGWADLDGPVDVRVGVKAPRDVLSLAQVPPRVLDLVAADGMVTVPVRVTGTIDRPRVGADTDALADMGRTAVGREIKHQAERAAERLLGKIFGH
jgi:hypothetical protein